MMRTELFWPLAFCGFAAVSLVCGIVAWPQLSAVWPSIEEKIDQFRRQPPFVKLLLMLFVGAFVVFGSTKPNGVDQTGGTNEVEIVGGGGQSNLITCAYGLEGGVTFLCPPPLDLSTCYPGPTVTPEDIARGWRLCEVRTNSNISYAMPGGATLATNWWVRGAYEDVKKTGLGGLEWRFPLGANEYDSAWAFTWGKLRFVLRDAETEIVAVGAPMSAVPYCSRLWSVADTNGARIVTWEDFVLGRASVADYQLPSTNYQLVSAQIELRSTGDFVTRSNEVETVYRRVDPDDWDGDGWENGDDSDPYAWEDFREDFRQELPDEANTNAYCWIEIRPRWNSWIEFYGDAPSDLSDPCFWAKAGKAYRVQLLIGKTYGVASTQPFDILAKSDERIEVSEYGMDQAEVVWPVEFTVAEGRAPTGRPRLGATWNDGGKSFHVLPDPPWLRGAITWTNDVCCNVWGDGTNFTYACDNTCHCEGCTVYGNYWYEGYRLPVWGIPCGCRRVPDHGPAGVSVSFDCPAVIYEDAYTNMPGEVVHPARTNVVLRCSARGGTYGGTFSVTLNTAAQQKLRKVSGDTLPQDVRVEPDTSSSYEVVYSVLEPSGRVGDIGAEAVFLEDFRNETHTNAASMTAVKVELTPEDLPPMNPSPNRHIMGISEKVNFSWLPEDADVEWRDESNDGSVLNIVEGSNYFFCPWTGGLCRITASFGSADYEIPFNVYEPSLDVRNATWDQELDSSARAGESGWVGMLFDIYLLPNTVSFMGIYMEEIPVPSSEAYDLAEDDYFALLPGVLPVTHDGAGGNDAGAGRWHQVHYRGGSNYWTSDKARMPHSCPPLPNVVPDAWAAGTMRWQIPIGWGDVHGNILGQFDPNPTEQVYEMETNGSLTIRKYDHHVKRDVEGRVWFDGSRVNAWWNGLL